MKSYEIYDNDNGIEIGCLLYYERDKCFIVELKDTLDEWNAPLLFCSYVKKGIYTIPRDISLLWVRERIIPSERQNISMILKNHKLKEYDEMKFMEISEGRSSQDGMFIKRIDILPGFVKNRMEKNLSCVFATEDRKCICFFADGTARRIDLRDMNEVPLTDKIINNESLFKSICLGAGGYYLTFNDSIDIPAWMLYNAGVSLNVTKAEFVAFVENGILDTTETGKILSCSRQNISYMVKNKQISPIKKEVMGNLYLKDDVLKSRW